MFHLLVLMLLAGPPSVEWSAVPSGGMVAVECAGDVNSDGTDDIFAASDETLGYGIMCLDGISGEVIWLNDSIRGAFTTGCLRAIGDTDLDGIVDLAVGTGLGLNYAVTTLSGATGNVIWSAPQSNRVHFVQYAVGPNPGDVIVLSTKVTSSNHFCTFFALNGQTGDVVWSSPAQSTLDYWIRTTDADVSGNDWSEMGYSVDRGSVSFGYVHVKDGITGGVLQSTGTMYYGTMDICSSPGLLAVSHFGIYPIMWMESIISGDTIWSSDDTNMSFISLDFIPNITGSSTPYPEIIGWSGPHLTLIRGDDGYHQNRYEFPNPIASVDCYLDEIQWKLALITETSFRCPDLVFESPTVEPSIMLPNSGGADLCLLESDLYSTPLAAIAMSGPGPGVCVIRTSWPVEINRETTIPIPEVPSVRLLSVPGRGCLVMIGESQVEVMILDITGRAIDNVSIGEGERVYVQLGPGVYQLIDGNSGRLLHMATVLCK